MEGGNERKVFPFRETSSVVVRLIIGEKKVLLKTPEASLCNSSQILPFACPAVHVIINFSLSFSFSLFCFYFQYIVFPDPKA